MISSDLYSNYTEPLSFKEKNDFDSVSVLDFGEGYLAPPGRQLNPRLVPVYNGKVLNIQPELVHASLSGISIKHYNGKCYVEEEEDEDMMSMEKEREEDDIYIQPEDADSMYSKRQLLQLYSGSSAGTKSTQSRKDLEAHEGQPICTLYRINFRNSFWNIHRPELCKLTWAQNYVSAAVVTDHLHEHLMSHGSICEGFHTEEERNKMLSKELDEYVHLKVLAYPRELPPDEPLFKLKVPKSDKRTNPKCKIMPVMEKQPIVVADQRVLSLSDDEDTRAKSIHRSREEFCLTIGKALRPPDVEFPQAAVEEESEGPGYYPAEEDEEEIGFQFNWFLYGEETESYNDESVNTTEESSAEIELIAEPCPPLMLDEFCRNIGKADFSDLRCNPDL